MLQRDSERVAMRCFSRLILIQMSSALVGGVVQLVCDFIRQDNPRRGARCLPTFKS